MESQPVIRVDARGLRCPLPVLRLRRMAEGRAGLIELLSDDPAAEADVPAFIREKGWRLEARTPEGGATRWLIDLGGEFRPATAPAAATARPSRRPDR